MTFGPTEYRRDFNGQIPGNSTHYEILQRETPNQSCSDAIRTISLSIFRAIKACENPSNLDQIKKWTPIKQQLLLKYSLHLAKNTVFEDLGKQAELIERLEKEIQLVEKNNVLPPLSDKFPFLRKSKIKSDQAAIGEKEKNAANGDLESSEPNPDLSLAVLEKPIAYETPTPYSISSTNHRPLQFFSASVKTSLKMVTSQ